MYPRVFVILIDVRSHDLFFITRIMIWHNLLTMLFRIEVANWRQHNCSPCLRKSYALEGLGKGMVVGSESLIESPDILIVYLSLYFIVHNI